MAKQRNNVPPAPQAPVRKVRIVGTPSFYQTMKNYQSNVAVLKAFREFITAKRNDPLAPFGSKDRAFTGNGLKAYKHSGLTFDISVVYTLSGRDPHVIRLYGLFSHDELGTGNPARLGLQKKAADSFDRQTSFTPLEKIDESNRQVNSPLLKELLTLL